MKIAVIVSSLRCGGVERVAAELSSYWAESGVEVSLIFYSSEEPAFFKVSERVQRVPLTDCPTRSFFGKFSRLFRRIIQLRRALLNVKPDLVLSLGEFMNILSFFALSGVNTPLIVSEHTNYDDPTIGVWMRRVRDHVYQQARRVVVLNEESRVRFEQVLKRSVVVIPNSVSIPCEGSRYPLCSRAHVVVGMGRLVPQKGFDLLLHAFSQVAKEFPEWSLKIYGEGPEREALQRQIDDSDVRERISLPGLATDASAVFSQAQIFVLSSRWDVFGLVLAEAMASGVAVIAFDCPTGPRTLIHHEVNGILVSAGSCAELGNALRQLMQNEELRVSLATQAVESAKKYSRESVMKQWDSLFKEVLHGSD